MIKNTADDDVKRHAQYKGQNWVYLLSLILEVM